MALQRLKLKYERAECKGNSLDRVFTRSQCHASTTQGSSEKNPTIWFSVLLSWKRFMNGSGIYLFPWKMELSSELTAEDRLMMNYGTTPSVECWRIKLKQLIPRLLKLFWKPHFPSPSGYPGETGFYNLYLFLLLQSYIFWQRRI